MRVLIVSNIYPSSKYPSFGTFVRNQVRALQMQDVTCILAVNTVPHQGWRWALYKYTIMLLRVLWHSLFTQFDLIHVHYVFPSALFALIPHLIRRKPIVITAHGGDILRMPYRSNWIWRTTCSALNRADAIVAVSEYLKSEIASRFGIIETRIVVSNMGIDLDVFKVIPRDQAMDRLHDRAPNCSNGIVLYVGRCDELKGGGYLLQAVASLVRSSRCCVDLWMVGDGDAKEKWMALSKELGISGNTYFLGARPQEELPAWFSLADVFVLPTLSESLGLVILEAMACGVPVIASNVGGIPELITHKFNGYLVEPRDVNALAREIELLLTDTSLASKLTNNAMKSLSRYTVESQAKFLINEVYEPLLNPVCL